MKATPQQGRGRKEAGERRQRLAGWDGVPVSRKDGPPVSDEDMSDTGATKIAGQAIELSRRGHGLASPARAGSYGPQNTAVPASIGAVQAHVRSGEGRWIQLRPGTAALRSENWL